jgi:phosphoglucomutase
VAISSPDGKLAPGELLIDPDRLEREYYERNPDPADPNQRVAFGTSEHRGTALRGT